MEGGMCSVLLLPHCKIHRIIESCRLEWTFKIVEANHNCFPSVFFARIKLIYESKLVSGLIPVFFSAGGNVNSFHKIPVSPQFWL